MSAPEAEKHLDGCCSVVLRLKRSPACSRGMNGHVVAYTVSYCLVEVADTGKTVDIHRFINLVMFTALIHILNLLPLILKLVCFY